MEADVGSESVGSSRASGAPRQKCGPFPKPKWRMAARFGSNSSGRSIDSGSRCAAAMSNIMLSPFGMSTTPIVMCSPAIRMASCTGGSYRMVSSTTIDTRPGSAARARHCAGCISIACIALAIRLTVVSWPAMRSRLQVATISSSVSWSPSSSAAMSPEIRSPRGSPRRRSMSPWRYSRSHRPASSRRPTPSADSPVSVLNGSNA
jgi:hypothetical protein